MQELLGWALLRGDRWLQSRTALSHPPARSAHQNLPHGLPNSGTERKQIMVDLGHPSVGDRPCRLGQDSFDFLHSETDLLGIMIPIPFESLYLLLLSLACLPPRPSHTMLGRNLPLIPDHGGSLHGFTMALHTTGFPVGFL